jgi:nicotinamide-nucleotide amidase
MNAHNTTDETIVRIIAVGDELLEGRTADTNSRRIQRALGSHAVQVAGIEVVPDTFAAISAALERTAAGDLVFMTGGLGSTPDDLTRDAVAGWGGLTLAEDSSVRAALEKRWRKRGMKSSPGIVRQCQVPEGMTPVTNPVGSAPGLVGLVNGRILVMLPGVPAEMAGLLPLVVVWLNGEGYLPPERQTLLWRTAQAPELAIVRRCRKFVDAFPHLAWSWWLTDWGVDVRVAGSGSDAQVTTDLQEVDRLLGKELGQLVYNRQMKTLPATIQSIMLARKQTLAVAESCTAGMIGARLTDEPGSSGFFRGGVMAYADEVKQSLLAVPHQVLQDQGAVSEETVRHMAEGCRRSLGTDYGVAVSGISGPDGGTEEKPVGTTWIAVATPSGVFAGHYRFPADRDRNRLLTVAAALDSLRKILESGDDVSPWIVGKGQGWQQ